MFDFVFVRDFSFCVGYTLVDFVFYALVLLFVLGFCL